MRLTLWYEGQDDPGFHLTVFHCASGAILDSDASDTKSTVVQEDDRVANPIGRKQRAAANKKAMRPFHESFPVPLKIEITEVWRCKEVSVVA